MDKPPTRPAPTDPPRPEPAPGHPRPQPGLTPEEADRLGQEGEGLRSAFDPRP